MQRVALAGHPDFWPVSKFNTGSLRLRGILSVMGQTEGYNNKKLNTYISRPKDP